MKSALAATLVVAIAVAIAVAAVPRSDLPPSVQGAKDHVYALLDVASPTAERVILHAQRAFDDVLGRVGGTTPHASRPTLSGRASVVDGDTLDVGEVRIRPHGVDAPESRQSCVAGGRRWACGERAT